VSSISSNRASCSLPAPFKEPPHSAGRFSACSPCPSCSCWQWQQRRQRSRRTHPPDRLRSQIEQDQTVVANLIKRANEAPIDQRSAATALADFMVQQAGTLDNSANVYKAMTFSDPNLRQALQSAASGTASIASGARQAATGLRASNTASFSSGTSQINRGVESLGSAVDQYNAYLKARPQSSTTDLLRIADGPLQLAG
jgi:hypothetical protein